MTELPTDCRVTIALPLTSEELARELRMVQATQEILAQNGKQGNLRLSRIERLLGLEPEDTTPARSNLESLRGEIAQVLCDTLASYGTKFDQSYRELVTRAARVSLTSDVYLQREVNLLLEKLGEKV